VSHAGEIESVLFKRVPGGYVYQAGNPWVFGPATRYVVNEAQKAELLAIITPPRPWLRIAVVILVLIAIAVGTPTLMWAVSGHDEPTNIDVLVLIGLILVQMYLALVFAVRRNLRRTQPITAGLPRTEERITHRELRKAMADAMSFKRTLLIAAAWTVTFVSQCATLAIRNGQHPLLSDAQSYVTLVGAIFAAGLAVNYTVIAVRKMTRSEAVS
jgi:hypothetical protein